jgi:hypothetical protein
MIDLFQPKEKMKVTPSQLATVKEIHEAFDKAADTAVKEAWELANTPFKEDQVKTLEALRAAGFDNCKNVAEMMKLIQRKKEASANFSKFDRYRTNYPNNKFITVDQVVAICEKYNLICGQAGWYKGEVPEKNAKEIAAFKPRNEDIYFHVYDSIHFKGAAFPLVPTGSQSMILTEEQKDRRNFEAQKLQRNMARFYDHRRSSLMDYEMRLGSHMDTSSHYTERQYPLFIAAPASDMNLPEGHEKHGVFVHSHIPDPIVLHFVKDGFLIVSKWGPEAKDIELVNEAHN